MLVGHRATSMQAMLYSHHFSKDRWKVSRDNIIESDLIIVFHPASWALNETTMAKLLWITLLNELVIWYNALYVLSPLIFHRHSNSPCSYSYIMFIVLISIYLPWTLEFTQMLYLTWDPQKLPKRGLGFCLQHVEQRISKATASADLVGGVRVRHRKTGRVAFGQNHSLIPSPNIEIY